MSGYFYSFKERKAKEQSKGIKPIINHSIQEAN